MSGKILPLANILMKAHRAAISLYFYYPTIIYYNICVCNYNAIDFIF